MKTSKTRFQIWMPVPHTGFEKYFKISNYGNIKLIRGEAKKVDAEVHTRTITRKMKNPHNSYTRVCNFIVADLIYYGKDDTKIRKTFDIHEMVARCFVKNPQPNQYRRIHHLDWTTTNNRHDNLIWIDDPTLKKFLTEGDRLQVHPLTEQIALLQSREFKDFEICAILEIDSDSYDFYKPEIQKLQDKFNARQHR